jgi:ferritin-like metal-binding protein YciE
VVAVEALRTELATAREELNAVRREVAEVVAACREAESRVAATRADADAVRRTVGEIDASAAAVRGVAEAARAEVERAHEQSEQTEQRLARLRERLDETRDEFAALDARSRTTPDHFRAAVEQTQRTTNGEIVTETAVELPDVPELPPEERADDVRERLAHLLNDAWGVEKEQAGLLQTLADESGDRDVRALLEEHRAAAQQRQEAIEGRLVALGAKPASGRGLLGQLATRLWEAVQAPRDQADKAVLAVLKALAAAEFLAGLYAAAHAAARSAGGPETTEFAAAHFRAVRNEADQLRAALAPTVERTVHQ